MLADLWFRLRSLFGSTRADRDLADELQFHLDCEQGKLAERGIDRAEAHRQARVAFGPFSAVADACRDARGVASLTDTAKDVRYAVRSLRRSPVFALTVAGSLMLGIGANVTVFTLMRAALWRPLPISHPEEIVHLRRANPANADGRESSFSYVLFQELREAAGPAAHIIAKRSASRHKFGTDSDSKERVTGEAVSDDFFAVLGVVPAAGRLLAPGDDGVPAGRHVAVLSHGFWSTRFGSNPTVVGRTIYYDESPYTVVGVAVQGFDGVDAERPVQVWIPVTADTEIEPVWLRSSSFYWLTLMARLPPSTNPQALQATLDARFRSHIERELLRGLSGRFRAMVGGEHVLLRPAAAGLSTTGRRYEPQLRIIAAIALCVFLICCANVANLVRARNERRREEFALRRALGASGARIFRQLLVEGLLLGSTGAVGGLFVAPWIASRLLALVPASQPLGLDLRIDPAIVAVAIALGLASALLAITLPAWRRGMSSALGTGTRVSRPLVVNRATVAIQLAVVLVLLVVAGLSLTMLRRLSSIDLGFDPEAVVSVELSFPKGTPPARSSGAFETVRQQLEQAYAIESSSYAFPSVYDIGGSSMGIVPNGHVPAPGEDTDAGTITIGPGFFATLHIPVHQGRDFNRSDIGGPPVVIVNETFARKYFRDRTPLGEQVRIPGRPQPIISTIVGVVADVRHYGVRSDPWPMVYRPGAIANFPAARLLVRLRDSIAGLTILRSAVESADATAQIETIRPLADAVTAMVSQERLLAILSSVVGIVALLLAALGLYGIVGYGVTCRRTEFGIRLALGARRADIQRLVLRETMGIVLFGGLTGVAGAFAAARLMGRLVSGAPALDWRLLLAATLGLVVAAVVAGWIPASRAARTDPSLTLRAE
jgi:putative ABC transport system permease protein